MRRLDIQTIRRKHKLTQKQLSALTGFPQGFISKMECGKVSTPQAFITKVSEVLKIKDIDCFVSYDDTSKSVLETPDSKELLGTQLKDEPTDKMTIQLLFKMLEKREARIEKLEQENDALRSKLMAYLEGTNMTTNI